MLAVAVGWTTVFLTFMLSMAIGELVYEFLARPDVLNDYIAVGLTGAVMGTPTILATILVYGLGKRRDDGHTRCGKCGYILKGLTEPRCSECGEPI